MDIKEFISIAIKTEEKKLMQIKENQKNCKICNGLGIKKKKESFLKIDLSEVCDCKILNGQYDFEIREKRDILNKKELKILEYCKDNVLLKGVNVNVINNLVENRLIWLYGDFQKGKTTRLNILNLYNYYKNGILYKVIKENKLKVEYGNPPKDTGNIIDDLGVNIEANNYKSYIIWFEKIIDNIHESGKPLWIASNFSPDKYIELIHKIDPINAGRIKGRLNKFYVKEITDKEYIK